MNLEIAILYLQILATLFMSIDYFISEQSKIKLDSYIKSKLELIHNNSNRKLTNLTNVLKIDGFKKIKKLVLFFILWIVIIFITGYIVGTYIMCGNYILYFYIFGLSISMIIVWKFLQKLSDLFADNIFPFILPIIIISIISFILYIKKGVMSGIGISLLFLSFFLRYYNLTHI